MSEIDGYAKWGLGSARMGLYNFSLAERWISRRPSKLLLEVPAGRTKGCRFGRSKFGVSQSTLP